MDKKKRTHRHHPPWWDDEHWDKWAEGGPWWDRQQGPDSEERWPHARWMGHRERHEEWRTGGPFLFARFALAFGLFALVGCGVLALLGAAVMFLLQQLPVPLPGAEPAAHPLRWFLGLLGLAFVLAVVLRRVGAVAAQRFTKPLSETMKTADALAAGDLTARVSVEGSGEFQHFARSFNHMAEALETADRHRRELLADVAHELRTPLTVIQGNLEGLRDGVYQATPEHLDLVLDETQKLSRLVDDLRLLTLAEAGQLPLDLQVLDVAQLLADVRDVFLPQADETGITLEVDVTEPLPALVADPQRLGQVLGNLVGNALRHTPVGGEVVLGAAVPPGDAPPALVRLWVQDTGEGIPTEDLPRIFERFWRGDAARTHEAGAGSGLGLAIAKSLVEAHGGRVGAESSVGEGTIVWCTLPLSAQNL